MSERQRGADDLTILDADGILPAAAGTARAGTDTMTARGYAHPALADGRVVVRLVPRTLGPAEDLAMEFLGFQPDPRIADVGVGVRRALGFPAWAMVHDPANGRHALAMVKEMERLARVAKSKPGNARDSYDALAARLDGAAPHFLPTFWEQAGRAFIAADNARMAGACFTRAREAESVHALPIDEDRLGDVHVEFALAGALPVKALQNYARELATRLPADRAYRQFRTVALQRVAGGLAPHIGMAEDMSRLAKAAGHRQSLDVLAELLAMPAIGNASMGFWKSYRGQLKALATERPAIRGRLLAVMPTPPVGGDVTDAWIAVLDNAGALAALTGDAPPDESPPGGATGWLERMLAHRQRWWWRRHRSRTLIGLVARMAPKLAGEGRPVNLGGAADLDVLDALLAAGVPVCRTRPLANGTTTAIELRLAQWLDDQTPGRRDLSALAADSGLAGVWTDAVRSVTSANRYDLGTRSLDGEHAARLRQVPAIWQSLTGWTARVAHHTAAAPSLAQLSLTRRLFAPLSNEHGAALVAPAAGVLSTIDVGVALARTLRTGLPSELHWHALDEAIAAFGGAEHRVDLSWPHAVAYDRHRAVIAGPAALRSAVQITGLGPTDPTLCVVVDGVLLALWQGQMPWTEQATAWWEGETELFPIQSPLVRGARALSNGVHLLPVPGGGVTYGGRAWHAHDRTDPGPQCTIASDGTTFWRLETGARGGWTEYDPRDGRPGRRSLPRFFERAGDGFVPDQSYLYPLPGGRPGPSPLGEADGLAGLRVRVDDGVSIGERIDGVRCELRLPPGAQLRAVVTMPGDGSVRALIAPHAGFLDELALWDPATGGYATSWRIGGTQLPPPYWHFLRPRDETGSAALRTLTDATATELLAAARPLAGTAGAHAAVAGVVARLIPAIGDATLRAAVGHQVLAALDHTAWVAGLVTTAPAARVDDGVNGADLASALQGVEGTAHPLRYQQDGWRQMLVGVTAFADLVSGTATSHAQPWRGTVWLEALRAGPALMVRAASPVRPQLHRAMIAALEALCRVHPVLRPGLVRALIGVPARPGYDPGSVVRDGDTVNVVYDPDTSEWTNGVMVKLTAVIQYHPEGGFPDIAGMTTKVAVPADPHAHPADEVDEYLAAWAEHGPPPWPHAAVDSLADLTGMPPAEAALILAGLPAIQEKGYPEPSVRDPIGVAARAGREANDRLRSLDHHQRMRLIAAVLPTRPADLWTTGPDVARVAQVWRDLFPARTALTEDLIAEAGRLTGDHTGTLLHALTTTGVAPPPLTEADVSAGGVLLPWLAYRLPAGHPARANLPDGYARLLAGLRHANVEIDIGFSYGELKDDAIVSTKLQGLDWYRNDLIVSRLTGPDDPALALIRGLDGATAARMLYSPSLAALMQTIRDEPAGLTGMLQDPRISAPDLVAAVARRHDIDEDAAAYYLQLLALPDPSDRNVTAWTGRPAEARARDRKALLGRNLVVEAKRQRAGRGVFLPGGWLAFRAPRPPIEAWKAPMYGWDPHDSTERRRHSVDVHVAELFRRAHQRIVDGDVPRLHSLEGDA